MKKKRKIGRILVLTTLCLIIVLNTFGLILETLFTLRIIQTDLISIKTLAPISTTISLALIICAILLFIAFYREKPLSFWLWNILMAIFLIKTAYKWKEPTALTTYIPYYFITLPLILIVIWIALFNYFKKLSKLKTNPDSEQQPNPQA